MKYYFKALLISLVALILASCSSSVTNNITTSHKSSNFLTTKEIKKLFSNKNIEGINLKTKETFFLSYKSNGTLEGKVKNGKESVSGKWYINKDEKCEFLSNGEMTCASYYKIDNNYYSLNRENERVSRFLIK